MKSRGILNIKTFKAKKKVWAALEKILQGGRIYQVSISLTVGEIVLHP
jgi:hypothetical protein